MWACMQYTAGGAGQAQQMYIWIYFFFYISFVSGLLLDELPA